MRKSPADTGGLRVLLCFSIEDAAIAKRREAPLVSYPVDKRSRLFPRIEPSARVRDARQASNGSRPIRIVDEELELGQGRA